MKKVIIFGAKGNLGQQLVKVLSKHYNVIAWDIDQIDITDKELIFKKIKDETPDIIINVAAYNAVDKCEEDEKAYTLAKKLNGEAVGYIAQAALEVGAMIVHYSTDYVFAGNKKEGYKEDDEARPISKYGESKLLGEKEIIKLSGSGLKWYLIRTSKLFGPKGSSEATKQSFFDIMLNLANEKDKLDAVNEEVSCFTYTPDLAKATKELVESNKGLGIYHIVNQGPCTWYEAARELFKLANIEIQVNPVSSEKFPRPAKRPKYSVLINTKLKPMRDWKEALKEYIELKVKS